jgi:hypothetical protein
MASRTDLDILPESFVMCLGNLFTAFGTRLDRPTGLMYWRALHDVPIPLLEAAIGIAVRERVYPKPPRPAEVRLYADRARTEVRERFAWKSCGGCSQTGWVIQEGGYASKCACVEKHARTLRELGADGQPLLSAPKVSDSEWTGPDPKLLAAGE